MGQFSLEPLVLLLASPENLSFFFPFNLSLSSTPQTFIGSINDSPDGRAFIKASTADSYTKINEQVAAIKSLSGKGIAELHIVGPEAQEGAIPDGCAVFVLTADLSVFLELGSRLNNIDAEIKKIQAKLQKSQGAAKKQQELMSKDGFEDKVSDVVLTTERKKLADAQSAAENYEKTIEQFQKMKLSSA
ncbi:hypothetical protein BN1723_015089 [Verticillium longisporum]|uniref:Valyl-tRNA synthetase tRNA-binding arm domain-containing protein n=1 Tax=Verticillium longisporum TaxID=100787 RepID=A0A0G4MQD5_VERLO|nr:hypothetical protein BN1723_015089 [Verticillium longisporum]